ncbi:uncharacterized protein ATNIH1004_007124 [Aspergillus tanneri]|uniref:Uncharacterized protein n=1 Tax=Aspergillus tanneri TaxID=1220188 RepID=A0A5M9MFF3_9EURO|nr:uncharacterized protein ATNIH1004_007124 [Aspergillus tanneri]KAA8645705.1 hypothetical protein ATNIH1004_007124 [Aspergillus tanneri]
MGFKTDAASSKPSGKQQRSRSSPGPSQVTGMEQQTHILGEETQTESDEQLGTSFDPILSHDVERSPKRSRDNAFSLRVTSSTFSCIRQETKVFGFSERHEKRRERKALGDANQNSQPNFQTSSPPHSSQRSDVQASFVRLPMRIVCKPLT